MTVRALLTRLFLQEDINFLLSNRIPRLALTRFMGWFSRIELPWVRDLSLAAWRRIADLDLHEAKQTSFRSLHDCFVRELKEGARPVNDDPSILVSPCDAIIGAHGRVEDTRLYQTKGFPYTLVDLLGEPALVDACGDACYVTLRITSSMYHRFHAPHDARIEQVNYISGDTWNVNPIALRRIERLFCRNERAALRMRLEPSGETIVLVAVAAVLVASVRLHCLDARLHLRYRGPNRIACDARYARGDELGWFEHGSTIILLAPGAYGLCAPLAEGTRIRMGEALLRRFGAEEQ